MSQSIFFQKHNLLGKILNDKRIRLSDVRVAHFLLEAYNERYGNAKYSIRFMATHFGVDPKRIMECINRLKDFGYFRVEKDKENDINKYIPLISTGMTVKGAGVGTGVSDKGAPVPTGVGKVSHKLPLTNSNYDSDYKINFRNENKNEFQKIINKLKQSGLGYDLLQQQGSGNLASWSKAARLFAPSSADRELVKEFVQYNVKKGKQPPTNKPHFDKWFDGYVRVLQKG